MRFDFESSLPDREGTPAPVHRPTDIRRDPFRTHGEKYGSSHRFVGIVEDGMGDVSDVAVDAFKVGQKVQVNRTGFLRFG